MTVQPHGHHFLAVIFTVEVTTEGPSASNEEIINNAMDHIQSNIIREELGPDVDPQDFGVHLKVLASEYGCHESDDDDYSPITVTLSDHLGDVASANTPQELYDALNGVISPKKEETEAVVYDLFKKKKMGG